jgi:predicted nucleic acid-binding protein
MKLARSFIDTNILIYAEDLEAPDKRARAVALLDALARDRTGVISTQSLQEFYSAATRKLKVSPLRAKGLVKAHQIHDVVQVTPELINEGIDISITEQLSFWDSLILAAAILAGCETLYSEDMNDGQTIRGVQIVNPFR